MEKVYEPKNYSSSDPIKATDYFNEYREECGSLPEGNTLEDIQKCINTDFGLTFTLDEIKNLEKKCSINLLSTPTEHDKLPVKELKDNRDIPYVHPITKNAEVLHIIKCKQNINLIAKFPLVDFRFSGILLKTAEPSDVTPDLKPGSTYIYNISVYVPFRVMSYTRMSSEKFRLQFKIDVLSTNTLKEFANSIKCISDDFIIKEVENSDVDLTQFVNAKEVYPSRCLFIENVFYVDMSHPHAIDYSAVIKKWALENDIGEFTTESMENVTFGQLQPRLGYGYVYIHQGECEHIIDFADIRLLSCEDCLISTAYPRLDSFKRQSYSACYICIYSTPSWMVADSDRIPFQRAFFCTKCLNAFMYVDGKKLGKFKLYPYCVSEYSDCLEGSSNTIEKYENVLDDSPDEKKPSTSKNLRSTTVTNLRLYMVE